MVYEDSSSRNVELSQKNLVIDGSDLTNPACCDDGERYIASLPKYQSLIIDVFRPLFGSWTNHARIWWLDSASGAETHSEEEEHFEIPNESYWTIQKKRR
jgi:hypothetical protein